MHCHHRSRGKVLFEVVCALGLAASFAAAWDDIGSTPLLASAAIVSLFAIYWSFGLFARRPADEVMESAAAVAIAPEAEIRIAVEPEHPVHATEFQSDPEPVVDPPKKRPPRKPKKAAVPIVELSEPVAVAESSYNGPPLEQLFDPQPFVRQQRTAFGRKSRGPRPLSPA
jgi:hypothetical protein